HDHRYLEVRSIADLREARQDAAVFRDSYVLLKPQTVPKIVPCRTLFSNPQPYLLTAEVAIPIGLRPAPIGFSLRSQKAPPRSQRSARPAGTRRGDVDMGRVTLVLTVALSLGSAYGNLTTPPRHSG